VFVHNLCVPPDLDVSWKIDVSSPSNTGPISVPQLIHTVCPSCSMVSVEPHSAQVRISIDDFRVSAKGSDFGSENIFHISSIRTI